MRISNINTPVNKGNPFLKFPIGGGLGFILPVLLLLIFSKPVRPNRLV